MEWALLVVALVLLIGLGVRQDARSERAKAPPAPREASARPSQARAEVEAVAVHGDDQADLEAIFAAVDDEVQDHLLGLLEVRMRGVMLRRVPVRVIRTSPAPSVARICFSDGTIVLATTRRPGQLMQMALAMVRTSVTLDAFELTDDGPSLRFSWRPDGELEVIAVGLDQAD